MDVVRDERKMMNILLTFRDTILEVRQQQAICLTQMRFRVPLDVVRDDRKGRRPYRTDMNAAMSDRTRRDVRPTGEASEKDKVFHNE